MAKYECENCAYETDVVHDAAAHTLSASDGRHIMFAPSVLTAHDVAIIEAAHAAATKEN